MDQVQALITAIENLTAKVDALTRTMTRKDDDSWSREQSTTGLSLDKILNGR